MTLESSSTNRLLAPSARLALDNVKHVQKSQFAGEAAQFEKDDKNLFFQRLDQLLARCHPHSA